MNYKIIDNLLERQVFEQIKQIMLTESFPWFYSSKLNDQSYNCYYFIHSFYVDFAQTSSYFNLIIPILKELQPKSLIRAKANLYPSTPEVITHGKHQDQNFPHFGAVFYVNSNDGYTELEDGTKVASVENRILIFDSSTQHQSTSCTNEYVRATININYF